MLLSFRPAGGGKALKLGGKGKDLDSFVDKLRQEGTGERFFDLTYHRPNIFWRNGPFLQKTGDVFPNALSYSYVYYIFYTTLSKYPGERSDFCQGDLFNLLDLFAFHNGGYRMLGREIYSDVIYPSGNDFAPGRSLPSLGQDFWKLFCWGICRGRICRGTEKGMSLPLICFEIPQHF